MCGHYESYQKGLVCVDFEEMCGSDFIIASFSQINPFQPSVAFHIETSHWICNANHWICNANQMTGFYMKCSTGLKWVKNLFFTDMTDSYRNA